MSSAPPSATPPGDALPRLPASLRAAIEGILVGPAERWLEATDALCGQHPEHAPAIRGLLDTLLEESARAEGVEPPAGGSADALTPGDRIGPYRIAAEIGAGGMGVVYLADQLELHRQVALKVIKRGMDTRAVLARFSRERRALAEMSHENVARVLDAGSTVSGLPYFVMERVEGLPLHRHCDEHRLTTEQRLELFLAVCAGVQHAHQKGILHRDLKPTNILVAETHGHAAPKIIDFGLARAIDTTADEPLHTELGQVVGTPEYMAPEQADPDCDVDTRADIYSLGVILYQLLTGELPLPKNDRATEPPRPSTRVTGAATAEATAERAAQRGTTSPAWARELRGDLDWIVLRALEHDRDRRYATAHELAEDVRRHLRCEPVSAGPPGLGYRMGKFVRRNRLVVAASLLVLLGFLAGVAGIAVGWMEAARESKVARAAEREARNQEGRAKDATAAAVTARQEAEASAAAEAAARAEVERVLARFDQLLVSVRLQRARETLDTLHPPWPEQIPAMERWLTEAGAPLADELDTLRQALTRLQELALPSETDDALRRFAAPRDQFLHDSLERVVAELDLFAGPDGAIANLQARLDWARTIEQRSLEDHADAWTRAIDAIARSDGVTASTLYDGLRIPPQLGLVPLGMDPDSGLWEFVHLGSGTQDRQIPARDADDYLILTKDTGIVFVLLPGGTFTMGAVRGPLGPNREPVARPDEAPTRSIQLPPFFLAKHEMTQGQWWNLSGGEQPSTYSFGTHPTPDSPQIEWTHPVESVSLSTCSRLLRNHGLAVPTEPQWEYACRAGTTTPWSWGTEETELGHYANVADRSTASQGWTRMEHDDGYVVHAPVGTFRPNAFGLYDVHGNVAEWTTDPHARYGTTAADPKALPRAVRGGAFSSLPGSIRSAFRMKYPGQDRYDHIGVRPARRIYD